MFSLSTPALVVGVSAYMPFPSLLVASAAARLLDTERSCKHNPNPTEGPTVGLQFHREEIMSTTHRENLRLHELIRNRRLQLNITQAEVAQRIGISSPDFISLVEKGSRRLDLDHIPRLAEVLQLDRDLAQKALSESYPNLYRALSGTAAPAVREDTQKRFDYELDLVRKLQQFDKDVHKSVVKLIETLFRKQTRGTASIDRCSGGPKASARASRRGRIAARSHRLDKGISPAQTDRAERFFNLPGFFFSLSGGPV